MECPVVSEAPRSKLRGIRDKTKRNCAGAGYPPSPRLRRGHLALRPHSKLWGIRAEASEGRGSLPFDRHVLYPQA
jgi:hypothetical protein